MIYSQVAMQTASRLDRTFHALADRTRRAFIHDLAHGESKSAGELGLRFRWAQPTMSKHLKVLEQAGLVERAIEGRVHRFRLRQKPLQEVGGWIARHQAFWMGAVGQLDRLLAVGENDEHK
jgi:DNA-binding transcriptional ArsR family regulator